MNLFRKKFGALIQSRQRPAAGEQEDTAPLQALSLHLNDNLQQLQTLFKDCSDVRFHSFLIGGSLNALLVYIEGICDIELIDQHVLAPLLMRQDTAEPSIEDLMNNIPVSNTRTVLTFQGMTNEIMSGHPVLLADRISQAIVIGATKLEKRAIEEPSAESVVRGPREGFTEALNVNTSLLRKIIKSPALKMKSVTIGRYTQTKTIIAYIEGIVQPSLIDEMEQRIKRIDIDGVLESSYVEELIVDNPYSVFPQLMSTERPDVVSANLLEGRAVLLVDGSPFALIAPISIFSLLQSPEDYYAGFWAGSLIRWLRYLFIIIALTIPSAYVAILTFHQEMVPTKLLLSIAKSREEIPFPALVEALLMEVTFEALREAGLRLPKQVGAAVSIVGALVIGQAAIAAGLVSAPMVMVVAMTGIASFTIPRYSLGISVRLLRFPLMFLAGMMGLLGLMLGIITMFVHLSTLRSFGVPYLTPLAPMSRNLLNMLVRVPIWMRNTRPHLTGNSTNLQRQAAGLKPGPRQGNEPT
ncbi:spore germination protein [Paenibacillus filicis]|uniref:Spore germination protein n=1 Tax=Paenibacillus gyeongsangnamensis TaxID=3388067 RepID=A0ABT4QFS4_9BACL|nr:spore germination protein [Paenibacillus filicis]MCZ8515647.1 spore germination protein [Paenibacillus filicis]